jgi:hypothetical protein
MNYLEYCKTLRRGDRIIIAISLFFSHHAIFWGWDADGQGWIVENNKQQGVRCVTIEEFFFGFNGAVETRQFVGTEEEFYQAMERVKRAFGTEYRVATWSCEQFANFVQYNKVESPQVRNTLLTAAGIALWLGGQR